jgi:hypothetical protein
MFSIVAIFASGRHTLDISRTLEGRDTGMRLAKFRANLSKTGRTVSAQSCHFVQECRTRPEVDIR